MNKKEKINKVEIPSATYPCASGHRYRIKINVYFTNAVVIVFLLYLSFRNVTIFTLFKLRFTGEENERL